MNNKNNNKSILLIHRYYYPDSPPYAIILEDMRKMLIQKGYSVNILSTQPSYKSTDMHKRYSIISQTKDGSKIYRLPIFRTKYKQFNQIVNFFLFPFIVFIFLIFSKKYNIISASTAPQILLPFSVSILSKLKGSKFIYHCMDIHPEIGRLSGEFKNKLIFNFLEYLDKISCNIAHKIIVLSEDMKSSLCERNSKYKYKIDVINNYDLTIEKASEESFFRDSTTKKRVIFAGNIGRYQKLDNYILALKDKKEIENLELIFLGEGSQLEKLKKLASFSKKIIFIPHKPLPIARKIISECDLGIVSLDKDVIKYAYPSKTMTYLSEGTAILTNAPKDSSLSKFILDNNLGIQTEINNLDAIYNIYKDIANKTLKFNRNDIKKTFQKNFSKNIFEKKIKKLYTLTMEEI